MNLLFPPLRWALYQSGFLSLPKAVRRPAQITVNGKVL